VARIDLFVTPEEAGQHVANLRARLAKTGAEVPEPDARHHVFEEGSLQVVFERHTEFVSYTLIDDAPGPNPLGDDILAKAPEDAFNNMPGSRLSAVRLHISKTKDGALDDALCDKVFGHSDYAASAIRGDQASMAGDFRPDEDGFMRFLVFDSTASDAVRGRMVQRILELEAYRMAAMLALPLARETGAVLEKLERQLNEVSDRIAAGPHATKDRDILHRLTRLAGEAEQLRAKGDYRFAAARAYGDIVTDRNERLRATRIEGHERVGVFIERRLAPALRTCEAVAARQRAAAERVDRAVQLLATRVQVDVEEQNASLLDAMNQRAAAQLRLQETVEAVSAVAITYYAVSLVSYIAKGASLAGAGVDPTYAAAIAAPVVFFATLFGMRLVRSSMNRRVDQSSGP
jgi:uncharacterized membrane-anchored protein